MKQVIVQAFCDGDHAERTEAVNERTVAIDGSDTIMLDVCEQCDQLFAVLLGLMERGAKVDAKPKKEGMKSKVSDGPIKEQPSDSRRVSAEDLPTTCPDCGFHSVSRTALGQHLRTKHDGKGFKDYTPEQMNAAERAWAEQQSAPANVA
jgi:hypothetical protein